ncbi:hypothetical protein BG32_07565 [Mesotoga sp. HF07.pep.5.2.highcov]|jgi:hypothetical protein|uniref:hypothetical protein n=1 Tax=Mesotoga sp. HF07.pep.5.2.highcov TaxID=1462923 RepID=UPI000EF168A6|nr:hypothetical protein [Mesotoga sp. HF07.pep.5.2.highcov]RLL92363.1 hypothetical protein BG32_07565 [Mesotoga sp. HF07.pep.5.2.highcov]
MSDEKRIQLKNRGIQLHSSFQNERREAPEEKADLRDALELYDFSLKSRVVSGYSVESLVSLSSIKKMCDNLEKKLDRQQKSFRPHSVVMKGESVTPVEIILKETPLKQWYTTGKTLGSLASIGAKVALQLLKNQKDEKSFRKLRLLEIEIMHRKLNEDH